MREQASSTRLTPQKGEIPGEQTKLRRGRGGLAGNAEEGMGLNVGITFISDAASWTAYCKILYDSCA